MKDQKKTVIQLAAVTLASVLVLVAVIMMNNEPESSTVDSISTEELSTIKLNEAGLDQMLSHASGVDYVLLGESSHGTWDYYHWRKKISQNLIKNHNFSFIAVEGDWAALYRVNQYVKHLTNEHSSAREILASFNRWPEWMWANEEFLILVEWLRAYNQDLPLQERVGIYGKDVYGVSESAQSLLTFLDQVESDYAAQARDAYSCLFNYEDDYQAYLNDVLSQGVSCELEIAAVAQYLKGNAELYRQKSNLMDFLNAKQDAKVVQNGESYYRLSASQGSESWNSRVLHMKETVGRLTAYYQTIGKTGKGIVWAHNTHVGDARATDMANAGMVNIGQLLREEQNHEKIFIVGFGTYEGKVMAGEEWGAPRKVVSMPQARNGSLEQLLASTQQDSFILLMDDNLPDFLKQPLGHRAKGVVYQPAFDSRQYVTTVLPERYNAFIFIRETSALEALDAI